MWGKIELEQEAGMDKQEFCKYVEGCIVSLYPDAQDVPTGRLRHPKQFFLCKPDKFFSRSPNERKVFNTV